MSSACNSRIILPDEEKYDALIGVVALQVPNPRPSNGAIPGNSSNESKPVSATQGMREILMRDRYEDV